MKILVICYSYSPTINPRSLRWTALCEEWSKLGHEIHVVTAYQQGFQQKEILKGVYIYRTGNRFFNVLKQWASKQESSVTTSELNNLGRKKDNPQHQTSSLLNRLQLALRMIYDRTWKKIYWPDGNALWIWAGYRLAKKIKKKVEFDLLVTVSHPFSCHIVGILLQRKKRIQKWIADSGDPFCFLNASPVNNYRLYATLNKKAEKGLLNLSTVSTVTTVGTAEALQNLFPSFRKKVIVIPPLIREANFLKFSSCRKHSLGDEKIIAVYVGGWHKNIRDPKWLLDAMAEMLEIDPMGLRGLELHLYGHCQPVEKVLNNYSEIQDKIVLHGLVSSKDALNAMFSADILVNVGNSTSYQLPSKVVEYLASGLPVLNICHSETDSSQVFFQSYGVVVKSLVIKPTNISNNKFYDLNSIAKAALFVSECKNRKVPPEMIESAISNFLASKIAKDYLKVLNIGQ